MKQYSNILQFPYIIVERLSKKKETQILLPMVNYDTWLWW